MLRLEDHDASMAHLEMVMHRAKASLSPEEFIEAVSVAFQESTQETKLTHENGFQSESSFGHFCEALRYGRDRCGNSASVLVLGCGKGYAGKASSFAVPAVMETFGAQGCPKIVTCDLTPAVLRMTAREGAAAETRAGKYDLVVAHSLLHYIPDLRQFFAFVESALAPGGALILAHEPNAAFWKNPEIQRAVAGLRRERKAPFWRKQLSRMKDWSRRARRGSSDVWKRVNRRLQERYGFRHSLGESEIRRLVDVHRPEADPGGFKIGSNGFDIREMQQNYLKEFRLAHTWSSAHLGYLSSGELTEQWRQTERRLAEKYPLDGCVFTSYWTRQV